MYLSIVALIFSLTISVSASPNNTIAYVTEIVTAFTTICPNATMIEFDSVTYTATESTTLTITNCPCTIVKPVYVISSVIGSACNAPAFVNATQNASPPKRPLATASAPVPTTIPTSTSPNTPIITSGANKDYTISGLSLITLTGLYVHFFGHLM
ncbi:BgTH12-06347 [Blumeria graminis f. sp. triticale]|uniref:Bgt-4589 n=3 Tax=Blumeria graminis TaxID=34373 RepID=A0A9X9LBC1_BLUGR|nr:hypothetical protein BGT96224_4589 [Blumeria graminis f. sp. tritici 96224]CAD6500638.1 BgTH12-06347 [Blumeria graminis f. sp. triticale]VCU40914.1 Bgt-4589 [Blumeria graminis f. sp. tritici]